ncbi:MAG: hypothetical protein ABIP03_10305 [Aquihabitans sp.]
MSENDDHMDEEASEELDAVDDEIEPRTLQAPDGTSIGGWVLRAHAADEVRAVIKTYGQVFEFPVEPGALTDLLNAGQPCFLLVDDPALKPTQAGIWAVGEVVGPPFQAVDHDGTGDAEQGPMAEVELWPLKERITLAALRAHETLSSSTLFAPAEVANPLTLRRDEVRALEEWEFELMEPTAEQIANLDEALDET